MYNFLLKIYNKINFKNIINNIIIFIIATFLINKLLIPFIDKYEYKNNKEISLEDKSIIDKELNADGKDIIIILDHFNSKHEWHGNDISDKIHIYFENYIEKPIKSNDELNIKIINLSFNEKFDNIENIDLINYNQSRNYRYKIVSKDIYNFETYIKKIKELNPNSKIVLSLSFVKGFENNKLVSLSKKYNYKISQAYYNPYKYEYIYKIPMNIVYFYFLANYDNTILVSTQNTKPLWYIKQISLDDIKHNKDLEDNVDWSTSYLTPILGYEYYLNKNSNIIIKDNIIK